MRGLLSRIGQAGTTVDEVASIASHLQVLLNAREGHSETVPGYGVLDFNSVVHTMPDGVAVLTQSIRQTIVEHEPRLEQVHVQNVESEEPMCLRFEIKARLRRSRKVIRIHTRVRPGGQFDVI